MNTVVTPAYVRVLFDETHSESWSICRDQAAEISPDYPDYSSYHQAAQMLAAREFLTARHRDGPLTPDALSRYDILVLLHPCDPRWERTVGVGSPTLTEAELQAVQLFVAQGGALIVVTEYEHDKYGDNLNELLHPFGLIIDNGTVLDRSRCLNENPAWILAEPSDEPLAASLLIGVQDTCFYQAGRCRAEGPAASMILRASTKASFPQAGLLAVAYHGLGRVVLVTDSLLFGDEHLSTPGHGTLWLNLFYWLAVPAFSRISRPTPTESAVQYPAWTLLKNAVNCLRQRQESDGSVRAQWQAEVHSLVREILGALEALSPQLVHQAPYLETVRRDLESWDAAGLRKPDFARALLAYEPHRQRTDGREHLALFPLYTPNACADTRFEALLLRMPWPEWLASLERSRYPNNKFAPAHLVDATDGYQSECAVLFPEAVSSSQKGVNSFATLLCDREARRLQRYARRSVSILALPIPPAAECLLESLPLLEDTVALWDLIHDRSHSLGELPFDPFMIRQRAPFWMYALEELRVDLRSFSESLQLTSEGFAKAQYVSFAILFDRLFRFPITGTRVKNYDGLAGQLLFAFLHERDILIWCDNRLRVDWVGLSAAIEELRRELALLYRHGATCSKLAFWIEGHDLISRYVKPSVASRWKKDSRVIDSEADPARWIHCVEDDEFPLGSFHLNLKRRLEQI